MEEKVEVVFKKPHRHGGRDYSKGDKIKVPRRIAEKLRVLGVI